MLSLLKKKSEADAPQVPPWHPNFRNFQRLPDTKVVRTAFFINTVAVSVTLALLIYVGYGEWNLYVASSQVDEQQKLIDRDKAASDQAIALFRKYQAEETKLEEVDKFVKSKPLVSELLLHLGHTLPKNIALDRFDLNATGLTIVATVRGAADEASGVATAYIEQLKADKELTRFDEIKAAGSKRNPQTGRITIEISLRMKTDGKDAKKS
jgi:hypothetical protein